MRFDASMQKSSASPDLAQRNNIRCLIEPEVQMRPQLLQFAARPRGFLHRVLPGLDDDPAKMAVERSDQPAQHRLLQSDFPLLVLLPACFPAYLILLPWR